MDNTQGSLPAGWITELKTHNSGSKAGTHYKCYIDPLTGKKFYSKKEVLRFVKHRKCNNGKAEPNEEAINTPCRGNVGLQTESKDEAINTPCPASASLQPEPKEKDFITPCPETIRSVPDFLPPGWIKEVKLRKNEQGVVYRKDPYYTDPVTGHVFRSKVEVLRYLETGVIAKRAHKPDKRNFPIAAKRQRHAVPVIRRSLFNGSISASDGPATNRASRSCSVSHDSAEFSNRRQSERIRATPLLKKQSPELDEKQSPELLEQQVPKKESAELEDGNQPPDLLEQQLLKKQSAELERGNQPSEEQGLKKESPELEDGNQSDSLEELSHLSSLGNRHFQEAGLPLKLTDKKPLETVVTMESEDTKLAANGWPAGSDAEPSKDVRPSESKKHTGNELPLESVKSNPTKLQDKLTENNQLLKSNGKKLSDNGASSKSMDMSQSFQESKEEFQMYPTTEKEANGKIPLDLESEDNKLLQDEKRKPKTKTPNSHSRKRKAENVSVLPRRASKRLAGLEADPTLNFEDPDYTCRQAARKQAGSAFPASIATDECQSGMTTDEKPVVAEANRAVIIESAGSAPTASLATTEESQPGKTNDGEAERAATIETENPSTQKAEKSMDSNEVPSLVSPFGDSWPDPCLEFAFKTLTSELSMDALASEDFFQQHRQLGGDQFSKPSF